MTDASTFIARSIRPRASSSGSTCAILIPPVRSEGWGSGRGPGWNVPVALDRGKEASSCDLPNCASACPSMRCARPTRVQFTEFLPRSPSCIVATKARGRAHRRGREAERPGRDRRSARGRSSGRGAGDREGGRDRCVGPHEGRVGRGCPPPAQQPGRGTDHGHHDPRVAPRRTGLGEGPRLRRLARSRSEATFDGRLDGARADRADAPCRRRGIVRRRRDARNWRAPASAAAPVLGSRGFKRGD